MKLYHYPQQAYLGRHIPKNKLYEQGKTSSKANTKTSNSKIEQLFVTQVEKIVWAYVLSKQTIKLADQADLKEIQIFQIRARTAEFDITILKFIDKLILSPIIFEIHYQGRVKVVANYKRLNQADKTKTVLNQYYASDWLANDNRVDLPIYLHLADLYEHFIEQLLPIENIGVIGVSSEHSENNANSNVNNSTEHKTSIEDKLVKVQQIASLQKQIKQLQTRINREKQFNRQVEMNMRLQKLQSELKNL